MQMNVSVLRPTWIPRLVPGCPCPTAPPARPWRARRRAGGAAAARRRGRGRGRGRGAAATPPPSHPRRWTAGCLQSGRLSCDNTANLHFLGSQQESD